MNVQMFEFLFHMTSFDSKLEINYFNPYRHSGAPKPKLPYMDRPFGPGYQTHPELSRSGAGVIGSTLVVPAAFVATPIALAAANIAVIESMPEHEQQGGWQMFISGLTGTFGIGSGLNL